MSGNTVDDPAKTLARQPLLMTDDYTVLMDYASEGNKSHREIVEELLPQLKEAMPEEEYEIDFYSDVKSAVLDSLMLDLSTNIGAADWFGRGFTEPEDFLDAEAVADGVSQEIAWCYEMDQTGKSYEVLKVVLEYAEEYDVITRKE